MLNFKVILSVLRIKIYNLNPRPIQAFNCTYFNKTRKS